MNVLMNDPDQPGKDPLNLRGLTEPVPEPGMMEQDWQKVSASLAARKRRRQTWIGGLAAAASVALVALLAALPRTAPLAPATDPTMTAQTTQQPGEQKGQPKGEPGNGSAQQDAMPGVEKLMAMSQDIESQLRFVRGQVGGMSSEMVVYQVELQDLIGQIDDALSLNPESQELWSQRLGLQLDLMKLYRTQLRRDHARLASL
jgi:hypothetical protein